jgi:hypothetical protein
MTKKDCGCKEYLNEKDSVSKKIGHVIFHFQVVHGVPYEYSKKLIDDIVKKQNKL